MWLEWLFIIVILVWFCHRRYQNKQFIKSVKHKQKKHIETLYTKFKNRFSNSNEGALPSSVDRVYCIYSDNRKDYIQNQFSRFNLNVTYFKGIFPKDLTTYDYDTLSCTNTKHCNISDKKTRLPVQLSFVMCMMDAMKRGYKTIMIFEDDIDIKVDRNVLDKSLDEFQKSPYEMFYMGYCKMSCFQAFDKKQHEYIVEVPNKSLVCHHAIAMKTAKFKDILDYLFPMTEYKDQMFKKYLKDSKCGVCVPKISYFDQRRDLFKSVNGSTSFNHLTCNLS